MEKIDEKEDKPEEEVYDFNKPDFEFIPQGSHQWVQQGYYIICRSCILEHASWIGPSQILTGIEEGGKPILKRR